MRFPIFFLSCISHVFLICLSGANGASFQGIGFLPGQSTSSAASISGDGLFVAGNSGSEAFRWNLETGIVGLGDIPGGRFYSDVVRIPGGDSISSDGSVIVGRSLVDEDQLQGFRWTQSEGMVGLGSLSDETSIEAAVAVSADGKVIVGNGRTSSGLYEAVIWTQEEGVVDLRALSPPETPSLGSAVDISADGTVVALRRVGGEAARWTADGRVTLLGQLPGAGDGSQATGISADGRVIFGSDDPSLQDPVSQPFRWTEDEGLVGLGNLPGRIGGRPVDATYDGAVIIGTTNNPDGSLASPFIWDATNGIRDLSSVLTDTYELDLSGWQIDFVSSISDDGNVIVGTGRNPAGQQEGWIANLVAQPQIPALDQESFGPIISTPAFVTRIGNAGSFHKAQTFATGIAGTLDGVELYLSRGEQVAEPLLLDVRLTSSEGIPTEADQGNGVLGTVEISALSVTLEGGWVEVDLSSLGIEIEAGQQLALVLQSNSDEGLDGIDYQWFGSTEGTYSPGAAFDRSQGSPWTVVTFPTASSTNDLYFRTFVQPTVIPEPATASLAAVALFALSGRMLDSERPARMIQ